MGTELIAKYKIQASGSSVVPGLGYTLGIVNWHQEELKNLERKRRELLTIHGQHHPKADVDRLYLMHLEAAHALKITKLFENADRKEVTLIQFIRTHQHSNDSSVLQTARCLEAEVQRETKKKKQSGENKRMMAREEDAWTIAT